MKYIFAYLLDTVDLGLFYEKNQDLAMVGYHDVGIYHIPIIPYHRLVLSSRMEVWPSLESREGKTLVAASTTYSECMKQHLNLFGFTER